MINVLFLFRLQVAAMNKWRTVQLLQPRQHKLQQPGGHTAKYAGSGKCLGWSGLVLDPLPLHLLLPKLTCLQRESYGLGHGMQSPLLLLLPLLAWQDTDLHHRSCRSTIGRFARVWREVNSISMGTSLCVHHTPSVKQAKQHELLILTACAHQML